MNWGIIFGKQALERGRQFYNAGKVKDLVYTGGRYEAVVRDGTSYRVEICIAGKVIRSMRCSCSYAEGNRYCDHMAAVLTAIERRRVQEKLKDEAFAAEDVNAPVNPFECDKGPREDGAYSYFNMYRMTKKMSFTRGLCAGAEKLIESGTVLLDEVSVGYAYDDLRQENEGAVCGHVEIRSRSYPLKILFGKRYISEARCQVPGCSRVYYGSSYGHVQGEDDLCVHELALLLLLGRYIKEYRPGDTTDLGGARVLSAFRKRRAPLLAPADEKAGLIRLEPRIENLGRQPRLSFRIGMDKAYVVKNLSGLVAAVEAGEEVRFGMNLTIRFAGSRFTKESQKYYAFIERAVKEERHRAEELESYVTRYRLPSMTIKGSIDLYGSRLDEAFELFRENGVEYVQGSGGMRQEKKRLSLLDGDPDIHLSVRKDMDAEGVFHGVAVEGSLPKLWEGADYYYYLAKDSINRVPASRVKEILPLYAAGHDGRIFFHVGRNHLSEFYYSTLPRLRQFATVEESEAEWIESYLPPEPNFSFYLDAEDKNATCQIRVQYGEESVSVMDLMQSPNAEGKGSFRDASREREVISCVQAFFPEVDAERDLFHCGEKENQIFEVLERGIDQLLVLGEVHSTDRFRRLNIRRRPQIAVGVSVESDIMNLEISSEDFSQEELLDILYSYRQKRKFYRLKSGDFLNMEEENLEVLSQMMEGLRLNPAEFVKGKMQIPVYRAMYLDQMLSQSSSLYASRDRRFKNLVKEFKTVNDSDFETPKSLKKILRKYQITGYRWMRTLCAYGFGGILADDMGLGKTLQMIAVLLARKTEGEGGVSLIVSPASLVFNWQEELRRFAPELSVGMLVGNQRERRECLKNYQNYDVMVTSYDLLKRDIAAYHDCEFAVQVLDEAQYVKNFSTTAAKSVKVIRSRSRFALTGTPIENRLSELWSIFDYLMPGFLYSYDTFKKELETPVAKNRDAAATERLKKMVSPFILRRLKQEVLKDLPEKLEETRYARPGERQRELYDAQVVHMRMLLSQQSDANYQKNKLRILAELTKIRQICCDPSLCLENYSGGSAKREACMDLIQSAIEGEHKMLVFSQFTSMLELLEKDLKEREISCYKITGDTPKEKRLRLVSQFNEDSTPVFLISLKAGGTGLNLTGADVVIHYDPWWNLAVQNQATDRAHRLGQEKVVSVYRLIIKDSIEEKILHMQESKKDLADEILSGETGGIAKLSREDLLELIQ